MSGSLKDQLMNLSWRIANLTEHCAFHKGDRDAKRLLKALKSRKKRWVDGLKRNPVNHPLLISLRLMRKPKEESAKSDKVEKNPTFDAGKALVPGENFPSHKKVKEYLSDRPEVMNAFLSRRGQK